MGEEVIYDVRFDGIGWRTVRHYDQYTVTVNGQVEDETYPINLVREAIRRDPTGNRPRFLSKLP